MAAKIAFSREQKNESTANFMSSLRPYDIFRNTFHATSVPRFLETQISCECALWRQRRKLLSPSLADVQRRGVTKIIM
jgi:hypothetical protein